MFSIDYPTCRYRKPNRRMGRLCPAASCAPVRPPSTPPVPYVSNYNSSCKMNASREMNRPTLSLWFLASCPVVLENQSIASAYGTQQPPICTYTFGAEIPFQPYLHPLSNHFPSTSQTQTKHYGAFQEGRCQQHLVPSSRGDHLHGRHQGG
jgi:hypothetical protein